MLLQVIFTLTKPIYNLLYLSLLRSAPGISQTHHRVVFIVVQLCFFLHLIYLNFHWKTNQTKRIFCCRLCVDQMHLRWFCWEISPSGFELGTWTGHMVVKKIYIELFIRKYHKAPCKSPAVQEGFRSELKCKYLWGKTWQI